MGYKFSLVLSRLVTDDESAILQEANCTTAILGTDTLPTNAEVTVTKMDFDDMVSPSLAEAIESALAAVNKVPDLSVPGLTVPAQPAAPVDEDAKVVPGEVIEEAPAAVAEEAPAEEKPATQPVTAKKPVTPKPVTPKTSTRKTSAKKTATSNGHAAENGVGAEDDAMDLVEAAAGSD